MIHYRQCLKRMVERAVKDSRFPANSIQEFAPMIPISLDAFNNRLYGFRTDQNDSGDRFDEAFLNAVVEMIRTDCPDIYREYLREFYRDPSITLINDALLPSRALGFSDLEHLALKLGAITGKLQGQTVESLADNFLSPKEQKAMLDLAKEIRLEADRISAAITNHHNGNGIS